MVTQIHQLRKSLPLSLTLPVKVTLWGSEAWRCSPIGVWIAGQYDAPLFTCSTKPGDGYPIRTNINLTQKH